jgi:hypothetical protein
MTYVKIPDRIVRIKRVLDSGISFLTFTSEARGGSNASAKSLPPSPLRPLHERAAYNGPDAPDVTKPRGDVNYSPYFPAAGLYSLLSDSFGPVP